jgi:hypothetical protein
MGADTDSDCDPHGLAVHLLLRMAGRDGFAHVHVIGSILPHEKVLRSARPEKVIIVLLL